MLAVKLLYDYGIEQCVVV